MKALPKSNKRKTVSKNKQASSPIVQIKRQQKRGKLAMKVKNPNLPTEKKQEQRHSFPVVAIGASAGGLEAVTQLLQNLSSTTGMAYIYVQHLSPDHESILVALLSKITEMKVQNIEDMEKMVPNNVYVIPYNKDIEVRDGHIGLIPRPKNKTSNLSIDVLFSSLAETHKENVIGIVLSGAASDGTRGLMEIKEAGGVTFAQDDSAKFASMPQSAIAAGVVDFILSPKEIAKELLWMSKHPLLKRKAAKLPPEDEIENSDPHLKSILVLLSKKMSVDFSHYKMSTIKRRILRRMLIHKIKTVKEYANFLAKKSNEVELLYQDLLINVTDFFRDADTFQFLKTTLLPQLLKRKMPGEPVRIWIAACATGEEVYSIAMILFEILDHKKNNILFQIFASDLSAEAIAEARNGEYSIAQLKNVSQKRIQRFFEKSKDKYRISKTLRNVCVFAQHNILHDPPFSRMDLISCRNLLIYMDVPAQKKIIETFHFALNNDGCLILGKSETIGTATQLFSPLNKKYKIYSRKKSSTVRIPDLTSRFLTLPGRQASLLTSGKNNTGEQSQKKIVEAANNLGAQVDSVLLSRYMPASVVISPDMEVLEFRGSTELYLKHASGKASFNILKMARIEIAFELRNAIHNSIKTKKTARKTGIEIKVDSKTRIVSLEVSPLDIGTGEPLLLVIFTEQQQVEVPELGSKGGKSNSLAKDKKIRKLEEELAAARTDMGTITDDQEAANEELQSANEEIVSSNEEMQSLNEELETSKEEIESTNEELITSNQELHVRIQQVEELYTYSEAILATVHEPMLILDKDMRIKSANKSFCKLFHIIEEESIGISLYKLDNNQWNIPRLRELLDDIVPKNVRVHDFEVEHTFPVIGHKMLILNAHRVIQKSRNEELIVLAFTDVTEVKTKAVEPLEKDIRRHILDKAELKRINRLASETVKAKQQFLSNMSHEIRTPMNAIIGFTNVVLKTKLDEQQKQYLHAIKTSGDALILLINDILDLAKVDAGKMIFEQAPFNLSASITDTLHLFKIKIQEKNLELVSEYDEKIPEVLIGDPMRLRQIILNLVGNAVKFTAQGKIGVNIRMLHESARKVSIEFTVVDTGIGIQENQLEHIFNDFEQASYENSKIYGGTGLGLSIVKKLVELQGGTLIVKSKFGEGSTFGFILDFGKTSVKVEKLADAEIKLDTATKKVKVLVVEDLPLNQLLIKILLADFGFEFDVVSNGKLAIEKLSQKDAYGTLNNYDIILMDLQMPEMDGFEATAYIRNKLNSSIPIIALTADVTSIDIEKSKSFGMDNYISKPIDEKTLYTKIMACLKKSKQK